MAKFKYRMQNILDIKYQLETQAKSEFAEANARFASEEQKMKSFQARKQMYELEGKILIKGNLDMKKIHTNKRAIAAINEQIERQKRAIDRAKKDLERSRNKLNEIMMDRKAHEKLKEKAFEEFKLELLAEESKQVDELVSYTHRAD